MQSLQYGGHSEACNGQLLKLVRRLTLFLTFGVIALHEARLPNLNVEGFVLLILLVINYFHLDDFTGRKGRGKEKVERRRKRRQNDEDRKSQKLEEETENKQHSLETVYETAYYLGVLLFNVASFIYDAFKLT